MPDHLHLIAPEPPTATLQARFVGILAAYARVQKRPIWSEIPPGEEIPNQDHLQRAVRYVHLNPCRERLVRDPLEWEWSTHRDAVGAAAPSWIGSVGPGFHAYVSGDPSVAVGGTPPPELGQPIASLAAIERAVMSATRRAEVGYRERRQIVLLARRLGDPRREALARQLGVSPRTVSVYAKTPPSTAEEAALRAAQLLLSDPRFKEVHKK
jgi:hypothetical protein